MNPDIYKNVITLVPVTILSGNTVSEFTDLGIISGRGAAQILRISLPDFPASLITFQTADDIGNDTPGIFKPLSALLADGITTNPITVTAAGGPQDIALVPYFFVSSRYIQIVSTIAVGVDTIINLALQPLIQATA